MARLVGVLCVLLLLWSSLAEGFTATAQHTLAQDWHSGYTDGGWQVMPTEGGVLAPVALPHIDRAHQAEKIAPIPTHTRQLVRAYGRLWSVRQLGTQRWELASIPWRGAQPEPDEWIPRGSGASAIPPRLMVTDAGLYLGTDHALYRIDAEFSPTVEPSSLKLNPPLQNIKSWTADRDHIYAITGSRFDGQNGGIWQTTLHADGTISELELRGVLPVGFAPMASVAGTQGVFVAGRRAPGGLSSVVQVQPHTNRTGTVIEHGMMPGFDPHAHCLTMIGNEVYCHGTRNEQAESWRLTPSGWNWVAGWNNAQHTGIVSSGNDWYAWSTNPDGEGGLWRCHTAPNLAGAQRGASTFRRRFHLPRSMQIDQLKVSLANSHDTAPQLRYRTAGDDGRWGAWSKPVHDVAVEVNSRARWLQYELTASAPLSADWVVRSVKLSGPDLGATPEPLSDKNPVAQQPPHLAEEYNHHAANPPRLLANQGQAPESSSPHLPNSNPQSVPSDNASEDAPADGNSSTTTAAAAAASAGSGTDGTEQTDGEGAQGMDDSHATNPAQESGHHPETGDETNATDYIATTADPSGAGEETPAQGNAPALSDGSDQHPADELPSNSAQSSSDENSPPYPEQTGMHGAEEDHALPATDSSLSPTQDAYAFDTGVMDHGMLPPGHEADGTLPSNGKFPFTDSDQPQQRPVGALQTMEVADILAADDENLVGQGFAVAGDMSSPHTDGGVHPPIPFDDQTPDDDESSSARKATNTFVWGVRRVILAFLLLWLMVLLLLGYKRRKQQEHKPENPHLIAQSKSDSLRQQKSRPSLLVKTSDNSDSIAPPDIAQAITEENIRSLQAQQTTPAFQCTSKNRLVWLKRVTVCALERINTPNEHDWDAWLGLPQSGAGTVLHSYRNTLFLAGPGMPLYVAKPSRNGQVSRWLRLGKPLPAARVGSCLTAWQNWMVCAEASLSGTPGRLWLLNLDDPLSGWQTIGALPVVVRHHALAAGAQGVVLSGGSDHDGLCRNVLTVSWEKLFDRYGWSSLPSLPMPVRRHGMVTTANGVMVIGGERGSSSWRGRKQGWWLRDIAKTGTWQPLPDLPEPRVSPTLATSNNGVYVIGGESVADLSSILHLDSDGQGWQPLPPLPEPLTGPAGTIHQGNLIVGGGRFYQGCFRSRTGLFALPLT